MVKEKGGKMKFGGDIWNWFAFIWQALRLWRRVFGDDEDKSDDDKIASNHSTEIYKMK